MARALLQNEFLREHSNVLVFSGLLHLALLVLLALNLNLMPLRQPQQQRLAIQATVVDTKAIRQRELEKERRQRQAEEALERRRREEQAEKQRAEEERRAQQEREQAQQRQAEQKQREETEARRRDEARRKQEAERARQEKLAQERRKAEEQKRAAAEAARKAEEQKRVAAEAARKAEAERQARQREADLARQLAAEEELTAAEDSGLLDQYAEVIRQKVERNWIRPASAREGLKCVVLVRQIPGGEVVDVRVTECNGDAAVVRSIEAAVLRSSPLPPPPNPALFDRSLRFVFRPRD